MQFFRCGAMQLPWRVEYDGNDAWFTSPHVTYDDGRLRVDGVGFKVCRADLEKLCEQMQLYALGQ